MPPHSDDRPDEGTSDLYVMQTEHGLIKIGRAENVEIRKRRIEDDYGCHMVVVSVFPGRGNEEGRIHDRLIAHRLAVGHSREWYSGNDAARAAIGEQLSPDLPIIWPIQLSERAAQEWIEEFSIAQLGNFHQAYRRKIIGSLKGVRAGLPALRRYRWGTALLDGLIWQFLNDERRHCTILVSRDGDRAFLYVGRNKRDVPRFTADVDAAMTLWPTPDIAEDWSSVSAYPWHPIECCIAALGFRWSIDPDRIKPRSHIG